METATEPHLADHLTHLRKQNQRPRSIRERRLAVLRMARHLHHPVAEVTRAELEAWQTVRVETLKPSSMHAEIVHASRYLKWLVETGRRPDDPSSALVRPRHVHQRRPRPMPDRDIARALSLADQPVRAWIGLGAFCGLRCIEIAGLTRDNIFYQDGSVYLRVTGKGGKERDVPLPDSLHTELTDGPFNREGHLFTRLDGKPGPPSAMRVSERINDYLHAIGIDLTAHKLRHRYGTAIYAATKDPFLTADLMGHASTDTTRGYVQLVNDRASAVAEQISQLGDAS